MAPSPPTPHLLLLLLLGCGAAASGILLLYLHSHRRKPLPSTINSKPQRNFRILLADNSHQPFAHLRRAPHTNENGFTGSMELHPFSGEIQQLLEHSSATWTLSSMYQEPPDMTEPYRWVQNINELEMLAEILNQEHEFAVDTEQHSLRSFLGFTALIQVSTRKQDFLIDTIALHDEMGILRKIFADPNICKVFHGADSDNLWLQRDFHIYIVNMFDTARACDVLGKPQRSLAYLLQTYCGITTNKIFQRADWRLRPLPEEMVEYARLDAHYLLHIKDCLHSELLQARSGGDVQQNQANENILTASSLNGSLFEECVRRSNMVCLQLYEKDGACASPAATAASLISRYFSTQKSLAKSDRTFKEDGIFRKLVHSLCEWRDAVARTEDESLRFVLSDHAILSLAKCVPVTADLVFKTICAADDAPQIPEASIFMTPFPLPSPFVKQDIEFLCNLFRQSARDSEHESQDDHDLDIEQIDSTLEKHDLSNVKKALSKFSPDSVELVEENGQYRSSQIVRDVVHKVPRRLRLREIEASRIRFVKKFSCKAPVYHNCRIFAGDGRLLCFCDRKKLDWYVQRGLAEFIHETPPAIRLLFEPKGRPEDENNDFYIQSKTNRCVGCGESSHYLRYRVIPSCYRQHFPEHLKSHRSHDIVLLCVDCHEVAHRAAEKHKRRIATDFGVPLFARKVMDAGRSGGDENEAEILISGAQGGVPPIQLRTAAMALVRHSSTMPKERQEQLEDVIRTYYGRKDITENDIQAALFVGKGPRELRRLWKKRGVVLQNVSGIYKDTSKAMHQSVTVDDKIGFISELNIADLQQETYLVPDNYDQDKDDSSGVEDEEKEHAGLCNIVEDGNENIRNLQVAKLDAESDSLYTLKMGRENKDSVLFGNFSRQRMPSESSLLHNKQKQKISLLGHGPHGMRVVEILLKREGEDGIRQFCQQWRAVFVEAIQPAFLPPGWDIFHSGRREFGDYSVYNPSKKAGQ